MTSEHGRQDSRKHSHLPSLEDSIRSRSNPIAFQDLRVGQAAQGVEGIWPVANRKTQNWNLSQSPMWSHRSPENKAPGEFDNHDDKLLCNALASGEELSYIKAFLFLNRQDIDIKALRSRANEIGTLWEQEEDDWLYCLIVKWKESDQSLIANLKNNWLTWRDADTLRARINHLKKNPPVNGFSQSIQYQNSCNQNNYSLSDPLRKPKAGSNYPATGLAQVDTNPYEFKNGDMPTDGSARLQHQHGYNVMENASKHLIDDQNYLDAGPFEFLPEAPDESYMGPNTTSASNDDNSTIELDEYDSTDTPDEMFRQSQQHIDHNTSPYVSDLPTVDQDYPSSDAYSSEPEAVSQSHHSLESSQQPTPPNEPGYPEHDSSYNSNELSIECAQTGRLTLGRLREIKKGLIGNLPEIKKRLAQGWTLPELSAKYCPQYRSDPMRKFLWGHGCAAWGRLQDKQVLELQRKGKDWAQISEKLTDPCRTQEEVRDRFLWLMGIPGEE